MKKLVFISVLTLLTLPAKGQFPFEKYPAVPYQYSGNWEMREKCEAENTVQSVLSIPLFFDKADTLTVQLTSFTEHLWERSQIRVFRNATEIQQIIEDMAFNPVALDPLRVADINGDGLPDIKIITAFMGNGTAALNVRVIYLFQEKDHRFRKISFF
jgi:hypothetical protein